MLSYFIYELILLILDYLDLKLLEFVMFCYKNLNLYGIED